MNTPLIFLDYDGVVTSMHETPGSFLNHNVDTYGTSPKCAQKLIDLCRSTKAKIVITSNWRKFPDNGFWHKSLSVQIPNHLPEFKKMLGDLVYSQLPSERGVTKSEALELWTEDHNEFDWKNDRYVIFDDDLQEKFQTSKFRNHFILTDAEFGLTDNDCKKARVLLAQK